MTLQEFKVAVATDENAIIQAYFYLTEVEFAELYNFANNK